jgi:hypothetical protein
MPAYVINAPGWDANSRLPTEPAPEIMIASDPFTRADSANPPTATSLGNTPVGNLPWGRAVSDASVTANYGGVIVGNQLGVVAGTMPGARRVAATLNVGVSDFHLQFQLASGTKDTNMLVLFRYVDMSNHLFLTGVSGRWVIYKRVGGTGSLVYAPGVAAATIVDGGTVDLVTSGNSVTLTVGGTAFTTQTITDFATGATTIGFGNTIASGTSTPITLFDNVTVTRAGSWTDL